MGASSFQQETEQEIIDSWKALLASAEFKSAPFPPQPPNQIPNAKDHITVRRRFATSLRDKLEALSSGSSYARLTILQTALRHVLARYTDNRDLVIGTPVFLREFQPGLKNSALPLARSIGFNETFRSALNAEKRLIVEAKASQNIPVSKFFSLMGGSYGSDVFGVFVSLQSLQSPRFAQDERPRCWFHFDDTEKTALTAVLTFDAKKYTKVYLEQIFDHIENFMARAIVQPDLPLNSIQLLSQDEVVEIMQWSCGTSRSTSHQTIVEVFEAVATRYTCQTAVVEGERQVSYAELNAQANHLAQQLQRAGVEPGVRVGVYLPRSLHAVIAFLGILKAGGVYVPLDPGSVSSRNQFIVEDASLQFVVTDSTSPASPLLQSLSQIFIEGNEADQVLVHDAINPSTVRMPQLPAYVLYTSGSTGRPKGVEITHRGVVRLVLDNGGVKFPPTPTCLLNSALTFDASTIQIWGALLNGGKLIISPDRNASIGQLAELIRKFEINSLMLTTALFHLICVEAPEMLSDVEHILVGGDTLSATHAQSFKRSHRGRLINAYGPTENAVISSCHEIPLHARDSQDQIPIGKPIDDSEVYLLDVNLNCVPRGVIGEIFLGGTGLAQGYLNQPARTAERFLPHPYSSEPGARLYASGDVGRFDPDGNMEFHGRRDHQVKIRGFRLEPAEVEQAILERSEIRQVVVDTRGLGEQDKQLAAYIVLKPSTRLTSQQIGRFLESRLPNHAIPSVFIFLDALPLTNHGKIDRVTLRNIPVGEVPEPAVGPRNPVEHQLAAIWQSVLHRPSVGIHDDFFEIGGDSLLALQIISRANKAGIKISAKQFFEDATIASCARKQIANSEEPSESTQDSDICDSIVMTPVQQWYLETRTVDPHHFNLSALFDVNGDLDPECLRKAIDAVTRLHAALRMNYIREAAGWRQFIANDHREDWLEIIDLTHLPPEEEPETKLREINHWQHGVRLEDGPLIKFVYFNRSGNPDQLLIVIHHLVIDGVSWRILLEDLESTYEHLVQGKVNDNRHLTAKFSQWTAHYPNYLSTHAAEAGRAYWMHRTVPVERNRQVNWPTQSRESYLEEQNEMISSSIAPDLTRKLLESVPLENDCTMEEALLALLALSFLEHTGDAKLDVTLDRHGRQAFNNEIEVFRSVGWFTSFFPVSFDVSGRETFSSALKAIKASLGEVPNQGVDYGILRYFGTQEEQSKIRSLPKPEVCFNYLGEFDHVLGTSNYFCLSLDDFGRQRSPRHMADHLLEVNVSIMQESMQIHTAFHRQFFERTKIRRFHQTLTGKIEALAQSI